MRTRPVHTTASLSNHTGQAVRATIDAENLAVVLNTLSNLYSDPFYAVVREYSTNALDAQIAAGYTGPIEVVLPKVPAYGETNTDPVLVIRDHGVGLDMDELQKTYLSYGASTKRDSDEFNGTLGLGSKSGLTYAPRGFTVTAVKDGVKIQCVIAQGEDGVGTLTPLFEGPTDEGNGVTITIPVEPGDEQRFHDKAEHLFRFWDAKDVKVTLPDGSDVEIQHVGDDENWLWLDDGIAVGESQHGSSYIVMGNVPYNARIRTPWNLPVIAYVPMGEVHFTPSREELHYTDLTNETIETIQDYVNTAWQAKVREAIEAKTTPWDRFVEYQSLVKNLDANWTRRVRSLVADLLPVTSQPLPSVEDAEGRRTTRHGYRWNMDAYNRGRRGNVQSQFHTLTAYNVNQERSSNYSPLIVTGFPYQATNLHPVRRERVYAYRDLAGTPYFDVVLFLPQKVDGGVWQPDFLDGYPSDRVVTWQHVIDSTPKPKRERGTGAGRVKTSYTYWADGVSNLVTDDEVDELDGDVVWTDYEPSSGWNYGRGESTGRDESRRWPGLNVIVLKGTQVDKFGRLYPNVEKYFRYNERETDRVRKAITKADKDRWASRGWRWLAERVDDLADPEMVEVVTLANSDDSDEAVEYQRIFGSQSTEDHSSKVVEALEERYPLLQVVDRYRRDQVMDDLVDYINGRYARHVEEQGVAIEAEMLANFAASGANAWADVDGLSEA
jgi:hypothetical protein